MARLVENSDDEFPDLAVILNKRGVGPASKGIRGSPVKEKRTVKAQHDQNSLNSTFGLQKLNLGGIRKEAEQPGGGSEKSKPQRRVLNKKCDNPLLGPLNIGQRSSASQLLQKIPNLSSRVAPLRSTVHGKAQETDISHVTSLSEEEEDGSEHDSTGLSDFIVKDSSFLEEESSEEESGLPLLRSTRRLVRGRRPSILAEEDPTPAKGGQSRTGIQTLTSVSKPPKGSDGLFPNLEASSEEEKNIREDRGRISSRKITKSMSPKQITSSGLEDPFSLLGFSPSEDEFPAKNVKETHFATPPRSPQKTQSKLISPKKLPQIPMTPHRPSMDAFWSQDVINDWNDEFSPRKTPKARSKLDEDEFDDDLQSRSPNKKSQSKQDRVALEAKKEFAQRKHGIAEGFLEELDKIITDGKVSEMASSTGGIKIIWSKKLNTTAGRANWKRETIKSNTLGTADKPTTEIIYRHSASIELAEKVIDDEHRLLNVIAHEFCHLANFMVSGIRNNPHGKEFKAWASKCSKRFGHRGIEVTTKHSYSIDYKYIWECANCGMEFKRHSKSINPLKHQCGSCKSKLVQTKPVPKANMVVSEYQVFVKENMKRVKEENPGSPQKEIMGLVGKMYQEYKASKLTSSEGKLDEVDVSTEEAVVSREDSPADCAVDGTVRKLDFLDLTTS